MSNVAMKGICWRDINESECSCPKCFGCRRKKGFSKTKAFKIASSMNNNSRRRNARAKRTTVLGVMTGMLDMTIS